MAGRTRKRRDNDEAISNADDSSIIKSVADATDETKDKFLKRVAKEDRANKKIYKKSDRYLEIVGKKVLEKFKNATGSVYTRYWFNAKRYKDEVKRIKAAGGHTFEEKGKKEFVPLLYIDGRPFKKD